MAAADDPPLLRALGGLSRSLDELGGDVGEGTREALAAAALGFTGKAPPALLGELLAAFRLPAEACPEEDVHLALTFVLAGKHLLKQKGVGEDLLALWVSSMCFPLLAHAAPALRARSLQVAAAITSVVEARGAWEYAGAALLPACLAGIDGPGGAGRPPAVPSLPAPAAGHLLVHLLAAVARGGAPHPAAARLEAGALEAALPRVLDMMRPGGGREARRLAIRTLLPALLAGQAQSALQACLPAIMGGVLALLAPRGGGAGAGAGSAGEQLQDGFAALVLFAPLLGRAGRMPPAPLLEAIRKGLTDPAQLNRKRALQALKHVVGPAGCGSAPWSSFLVLYESMWEFSAHLVQDAWTQMDALHPPGDGGGAARLGVGAGMGKDGAKCGKGKGKGRGGGGKKGAGRGGGRGRGGGGEGWDGEEEAGGDGEGASPPEAPEPPVPLAYAFVEVLWEVGFTHSNPVVRRHILASFLGRDWAPQHAAALRGDFFSSAVLSALDDPAHHRDFGVGGGGYTSQATGAAMSFLEAYAAPRPAGERARVALALAAAATAIGPSRAGLALLVQGAEAVARSAAAGAEGEAGGQCSWPPPAEVISTLDAVVVMARGQFNPCYRAPLFRSLVATAGLLAPAPAVPLAAAAQLLEHVPRPMILPGGAVHAAATAWLVPSGAPEGWLEDGLREMVCEAMAEGGLRDDGGGEAGGAGEEASSARVVARALCLLADPSAAGWARVVGPWAEVLQVLYRRTYMPKGAPERALRLLRALLEESGVPPGGRGWGEEEGGRPQLRARGLGEGLPCSLGPGFPAPRPALRALVRSSLEELATFATRAGEEELWGPAAPGDGARAELALAALVESVALLAGAGAGAGAGGVAGGRELEVAREALAQVVARSAAHAQSWGGAPGAEAGEAGAGLPPALRLRDRAMSALATCCAGLGILSSGGGAQPPVPVGPAVAGVLLVKRKAVAALCPPTTGAAAILGSTWSCLDALLALPEATAWGAGGAGGAGGEGAAVAELLAELVGDLRGGAGLGEAQVLSMTRALRRLVAAATAGPAALSAAAGRLRAGGDEAGGGAGVEGETGGVAADLGLVAWAVARSGWKALECVKKRKRRLALSASFISALLGPPFFDLRRWGAGEEAAGEEALHGDGGAMHWLVRQLAAAGARSPRVMRLLTLQLSGMWAARPRVALRYLDVVAGVVLMGWNSGEEAGADEAEVPYEMVSSAPAAEEAAEVAAPQDAELQQAFAYSSMYPRVAINCFLHRLATAPRGEEGEEGRAVALALLRRLLHTLRTDPAFCKEQLLRHSAQHRRKVRAWQAVCVLVPAAEGDEGAAEEVEGVLWEQLFSPNLPGVRHYIEQAAAYLALRTPGRVLQGRVFPALRDFNAHPQSLSSVVLVLALVLAHLPAGAERDRLLVPATAAIAPWAGHHNHSLRGFSQIILYRVLTLLPPGGAAWEAALAAGGAGGGAADVEYLRGMQAFLAGNVEVMRMMKSLGVQLEDFDPATSMTPRGIFLHKAATRGSGGAAEGSRAKKGGAPGAEGAGVLPFDAELPGGARFECAPACLMEDIMDFLAGGRRELREANAAGEAAAAAAAAAGLAGGAGGGASHAFQRKIDVEPDAGKGGGPPLLAPATDAEDGLLAGAAEGAGRRAAEALGLGPRQPLVVVASLIDKVPNLAGLARTCEVFRAGQLVVGDLRVAADPVFQQISVTAERWCPMAEVPPAALLPWLLQKRAEGYALLGVEQTTESRSLPDFPFPARSVLLLGREKEGIPVELIQVLDACIEIPQYGLIRSLNVHVSGALAVYEFTRQHQRLGALEALAGPRVAD